MIEDREATSNQCYTIRRYIMLNFSEEKAYSNIPTLKMLLNRSQASDVITLFEGDNPRKAVMLMSRIAEQRVKCDKHVY